MSCPMPRCCTKRGLPSPSVETSKKIALPPTIPWIHDCSAATENILLAVEALGLGAVWTAVEPSDALVAVVKDALKLPDNVVPLCVIPIGHPAVEAKPKDKFKPEKIHWNAY